jgi:hypothetical protein
MLQQVVYIITNGLNKGNVWKERTDLMPLSGIHTQTDIHALELSIKVIAVSLSQIKQFMCAVKRNILEMAARICSEKLCN